MSLELWPHQERLALETYQALTQRQRICSVLATGGGKSRAMAQTTEYALSSGIAEPGFVYVLCHSVDILEQLETTFKEWGFNTGWLAASKPYNPRADVCFISANTLLRRKDMPKWASFVQKVRSSDSLVIADEVHRSLSKKVGELIYSGDCKVSGWTATPWKLGKETLADHFETLIAGPLPRDLIRDGYLVPGRYVEPDMARTDTSDLTVSAGDFTARSVSWLMRDGTFLEDSVRFVFELEPEGQFIFFVADKVHARALSKVLDRLGHKNELILADTEGRASALRRIRASTDIHGISINVLSTGIDIPQLSGVVLMRHTMSRVVHWQQIGRGLRIHPGKEFAWVLDFAGNCYRHGVPEKLDKYEFDTVKPTGTREIGQKTCPQCQTKNGALRLRCFVCGYVFEDQCPDCGAAMYFTQSVCRTCGYDRRSEEERLIAQIEAQKQLELIKSAVKARFLAILDNSEKIRYTYSKEVRKGWYNSDPYRPLKWLQKILIQSDHRTMGLFQDLTKYTLWDETDVLVDPERYYQAYARWLIGWRSPQGSYMASEDVALLMGLQFGQEGRRYLSSLTVDKSYQKKLLAYLEVKQNGNSV